MRRIFYRYTLLLILSCSISVYSQGSKIITISEKVGETIDLKERNHFKLWSSYRGFISAIIMQQGRRNLLIINYKESGKTETVQHFLSEDEYEHLKTWIDNYDEIVYGSFFEPIQPFDIPNKEILQLDSPPTMQPIVRLVTTDGVMHNGKLLDVENEEVCTIDLDGEKAQIFINSIKTISYERGRRKGMSLLIGIGGGLIISAFLNAVGNSLSGDSKISIRFMLFGAGLGLAGGTVVEVIRAKSSKRTYDFQKLNQYEKIILLKRLLGKK